MKKNQFYCLMGVLIFMGMLISARVKAQSSMSKVPPDLQRAQKQLWKDEQQLNQARYQFALLRMKYFKINLDQKLQREKREGDPKNFLLNLLNLDFRFLIIPRDRLSLPLNCHCQKY